MTSKFQDNGRDLSSILEAEPLVLSVADGSISLPDLPTAKKLLHVSSEAARIGSQYIIFLHSLDEAQAAWDELQKIYSSGDEAVRHAPLSRALGTALAISYARCFDGKHKLIKEQVFDGRADALAAHDHWWLLRSKHFAHDANDRRQSAWYAAIDEAGAVVGLVKNQRLTPLADGELANAILLIQMVKAYLDNQLMKLEEQVWAELKATAADHALSKPDPKIIPPSVGSLRSQRPK